MVLLQVLHPIWYYNAFFYLFVGLMIFTIVISIIFYKKMRKRVVEIKQLQQQHVAKVDIIRKEHSDTLEKIRVEMLKREEERSRQWIESEKETLHVLNGVSILLDLSEKIGRVESEKILKKLGEIEEQVLKITDTIKSE
jgi:hypothetical protein